MLVKSVIIENMPTPRGHVYKRGTLKRFKDILMPYIQKRTCFAVIGTTDKTISDADFKNDNKIAGYVKSIKIVDGQAVFDIIPLKTQGGDQLSLWSEMIEDWGVPHELKVEFNGKMKLLDEYNEWGFPFVDTDNCELDSFVSVICSNNVINPLQV